MSTKPQTINIVIADDHKMFLDGLSSLLGGFAHLKIIGTATDGGQVLKILEKNAAVDIVITDISMPGMDGMRLTKEIRKNYPHIKILALSMHKRSGGIFAMGLRGNVQVIAQGVGPAGAD